MGRSERGSWPRVVVITLMPLFVAGGLAFLAVRTYPRDVRAARSAARELQAAAA